MSSRRRGPGPRKRDQAIDWEAVRQGIARAQAATAAALELSPERARAVLDERARVLSRAADEAASPGERLEVITFTLAGERYAIETRCVLDLIRFEDFTPVPGAPDFVVGIVHVRGEVVAAIELGRLFGLPARGVTDLSRLLVLGQDAAELGVLADAVHEVSYVRAAEVLPPSSAVTSIAQRYLRGLTKEALIVLDATALLHDERLFVGGGPAVREDIEVGK